MISSKLTSIKSWRCWGLVLAMGSCNKPASFFSTSTGDPNRKTVRKILVEGFFLLTPGNFCKGDRNPRLNHTKN